MPFTATPLAQCTIRKKLQTLRSSPQWVSSVESKAGVDNHGNPKCYKDNKKGYVSAFSVVPYDATQMSGSITWRVPSYDCTQRAPHFEALVCFLYDLLICSLLLDSWWDHVFFHEFENLLNNKLHSYISMFSLLGLIDFIYVWIMWREMFNYMRSTSLMAISILMMYNFFTASRIEVNKASSSLL